MDPALGVLPREGVIGRMGGGALNFRAERAMGGGARPEGRAGREEQSHESFDPALSPPLGRMGTTRVSGSSSAASASVWSA